jgi:hypothetical protein
MAETTAAIQPKTSGLTAVYRILTIVTTIVIVVQFFLAGLGTFHDYRTGEVNHFDPHAAVGDAIVVLSLLMLVAALLARLGGRAIGMVALLVVLTGPVQILLADLGKDHGEIWGALHAMNGALILGFTSTLIRLGRKR